MEKFTQDEDTFSPDPFLKESKFSSQYTFYVDTQGKKIPIQFPYRPYPSQITYISKIIETLEDSKINQAQRNAILESPTGTGKSLSLLCGLLGWLKNEHLERKRKGKSSLKKSPLNKKKEEEANLKQKSNCSQELECSSQDFVIDLTGDTSFQLPDHSTEYPGSRRKVQFDMITNENQFNNLTLEKLIQHIQDNENNTLRRETNLSYDLNSPNENEILEIDIKTQKKSFNNLNDNNNQANNNQNNNQVNNNQNNNQNTNNNLFNSENDFISLNKENDDNWKSTTNQRYFDYLTPVSDLPIDQQSMIGEFELFMETDEKTAYSILIENNWNWERAIQSFESQESDVLVSSNMNSLTSSNPTSFSAKKPKKKKPKIEITEKIKNPIKILLVTRTHSQIKQLISELRKTNYRPRMTVLASRDRACIHPVVSKSDQKNDDCIELQRLNSCKFANKVKNVQVDRIFDLEDLIIAGKAAGGCPYYRSRDFLNSAELIFAPYQYLINPVIRDTLGIQLQDTIVVIDEAHNIEDNCREEYSYTFYPGEFNQSIIEFSKYISYIGPGNKPKVVTKDQVCLLIDLLKKILSYVNSLTSKIVKSGVLIWKSNEIKEFFEKTNINELWKPARAASFAIFKEQRANGNEDQIEIDLEPQIFEFEEKKSKKSVRQCKFSKKTNALLEWLFTILCPTLIEDQNIDSYHIIFEKMQQISMQFFCLNPAIGFHALKKNCKSIILTSGTLTPLDSFQAELQCQFHHLLTCSHAVDLKKQLYVSILKLNEGIELNSSFKTASNEKYQDSLGNALVNLCKTIPFGVLGFFPSFKTLNIVINRWKISGIFEKINALKTIYIEKGSDLNYLEDYKEEIFNLKKNGLLKSEKTGTILFAVFRGRVSEGLDFKDDICRAVLCFGFPFPPLFEIRVLLKKQFNNNRKSKSSLPFINGNRWYQLCAERALNQAIGRGLRHERDFTSIIFMDSRFGKMDYVRGISSWIQSQIVGRPSNIFIDSPPCAQSLLRFFSHFYDPDGQILDWWEPFRLEKLSLLLCSRQLDPQSYFFYEYFPRDLFKVICNLSGLL